MRRLSSWIVAAMAGALSAGAAQGDIRYVNATASGGNDGSSWTDAFTTFQAALTVAQPGDEVWAALGTYAVPDNAGFIAPAGVSLYGGFVGEESSIAERPGGVRSRLTGFHPFRGVIVLTLTNATPAALTFTTEDVDSSGMHSTSSNTSRATAVYPGWYLHSGQSSYVFNSTGIRADWWAVNAAIANSSAQIALADVSSVIPVDEVVEAMGEIGASMETRYKETALGGLAATKTGKAIAKKVLIHDIEILPSEENPS